MFTNPNLSFEILDHSIELLCSTEARITATLEIDDKTFEMKVETSVETDTLLPEGITSYSLAGDAEKVGDASLICSETGETTLLDPQEFRSDCLKSIAPQVCERLMALIIMDFYAEYPV